MLSAENGIWRIAFLAHVLIAMSSVVQPATAAPRITAQSTTFIVTLDDGQKLSGFDLKGAVLDVVIAAQPARIRIAKIWRDKLNPDILLYDFRWLRADGRHNFCNGGTCSRGWKHQHSRLGGLRPEGGH